MELVLDNPLSVMPDGSLKRMTPIWFGASTATKLVSKWKDHMSWTNSRPQLTLDPATTEPISECPPAACSPDPSFTTWPARSVRERGLHQCAVKHGVALPCTISQKFIPMRTSADDGTPEMTSWPFLLPHDFAPWLHVAVALVLSSVASV